VVALTHDVGLRALQAEIFVASLGTLFLALQRAGLRHRHCAVGPIPIARGLPAGDAPHVCSLVRHRTSQVGRRHPVVTKAEAVLNVWPHAVAVIKHEGVTGALTVSIGLLNALHLVVALTHDVGLRALQAEIFVASLGTLFLALQRAGLRHRHCAVGPIPIARGLPAGDAPHVCGLVRSDCQGRRGYAYSRHCRCCNHRVGCGRPSDCAGRRCACRRWLGFCTDSHGCNRAIQILSVQPSLPRALCWLGQRWVIERISFNRTIPLAGLASGHTARSLCGEDCIASCQDRRQVTLDPFNGHGLVLTGCLCDLNPFCDVDIPIAL